MQTEISATEGGIVSPDRVRDVVQKLLHRAIHIDRKSYADLEADSGVKARAIKSYLVEGREPSLSAALSLAYALGAPAVNQIMNLIGYSAKPIADADEEQPMHIVASMMTELATLGTASADGRIDHVEAPACDRAAANIIAAAAKFRKSA